MSRGPLAGLLSLLELEALDADLFLGEPGPGSGRLFGGMVAAQSVMAAYRTVGSGTVGSGTVGSGTLHSLHAYFLRPGRHDVPIRFVVHRIRDGRTFTTRRVVAHQAGEAIFNLSSSFTRPEEGISHQDEMPDAPAPESLRDWEDVRAELLDDAEERRGDGPVEVRVCDPDGYAGARRPAVQQVWMRPRGPIPDDPRHHAAVLVYASDRTLLNTAARPHGLGFGQRLAASLDHALWLHREPRFDDWVLYASHSPVAHAARGLVFGALYTRTGTRLATTAQEGLLRLKKGDGPTS